MEGVNGWDIESLHSLSWVYQIAFRNIYFSFLFLLGVSCFIMFCNWFSKQRQRLNLYNVLRLLELIVVIGILNKLYCQIHPVLWMCLFVPFRLTSAIIIVRTLNFWHDVHVGL